MGWFLKSMVEVVMVPITYTVLVGFALYGSVYVLPQYLGQVQGAAGLRSRCSIDLLRQTETKTAGTFFSVLWFVQRCGVDAILVEDFTDQIRIRVDRKGLQVSEHNQVIRLGVGMLCRIVD